MTQGPRPTAVALDIDGTLIDHDEGLSPAVVDAVRRTAAQVPVILATGRAWSTTKPVAERFGLPAGGFVVCSNGARTLRFPDGKVVDERTFDPKTVIASVRRYAPNASGSRSWTNRPATRTNASCTRSSARPRSPVSRYASRSAGSACSLYSSPSRPVSVAWRSSAAWPTVTSYQDEEVSESVPSTLDIESAVAMRD